jgi:hypothetical protein
VPCGYCGSTAPAKNAWLCWAWNRADRKRVAYKQTLCMGCVATNLSPLLINAAEAPMACPACHQDAGKDMDPIYVTYILPNWGKENAEFATCGPCAVEIRQRAQTGAEMLPDREQGVGAAAPTHTATSLWDALGLRPPR